MVSQNDLRRALLSTVQTTEGREAVDRCWTGRRVGILGGSFDPAHRAHRELSLYALRHLQLDAVWWLLARQNPLKSGSSPIEERVAIARQLACHPKIIICDIERHLASDYTYHTLRHLKRHLPRTHLVWLMGSDNLVDFTRWHRWRQLFDLVPIAVLRRPGSALMWSGCLAAQRYRRYMLPWRQRHRLVRSKLPAWMVCRNRLDSLSSTGLRRRSG